MVVKVKAPQSTGQQVGATPVLSYGQNSRDWLPGVQPPPNCATHRPLRHLAPSVLSCVAGPELLLWMSICYHEKAQTVRSACHTLAGSSKPCSSWRGSR